MKIKFLYTYIFLFLILASFSYAQLDVYVARQTYVPGETVQIALNFTYPPLKDFTVFDFVLLDKYDRPVSIGLFSKKISNQFYYLYFDVPNLNVGTYNLVVKNYKYIKDNVVYETSKNIPLQINQPREPIVSVDPVVITLDLSQTKSFSIRIKNNGDEKTNLTLNASKGAVSSAFLILNSGESKTITTFINALNSSVENLLIKYDDLNYTIPIWVSVPQMQVQAKKEIVKVTQPTEGSIKFIEEKEFINLTLGNNDSVQGALRFENFFDKPVTNINFKLTGGLSDVIRINLTNLDSIDSGEIKKQYLWVNEGKNLNHSYSGELVISNGIIYTKLPIYVNYIEEVANKTTELVEAKPEVGELANETVILPVSQPEEKKINIWAAIFFIVILILIFALRSLFGKKPKPKKDEFEELISKR